MTRIRADRSEAMPAAQAAGGRRLRLPGLRAERELRCWSVVDLCKATGLTWPTVAHADAGGEVSAATARTILGALEAHPVSETARRLLGVPKAEELGERSA